MQRPAVLLTASIRQDGVRSRGARHLVAQLRIVFVSASLLKHRRAARHRAGEYRQEVGVCSMTMDA